MEQESNGNVEVVVTLNSGDYRGILRGKVAIREGKEFGRLWEIELLDHPKLKTVHVKRNQWKAIR